VGFRRRSIGLAPESGVFRLGGLAWLACSENVESSAEGRGRKKQYENSFNHKRGAAQLTVERFGACSAQDGRDQRAYLLFATRTGGDSSSTRTQPTGEDWLACALGKD
jgi:hypothetical protein